VIDQIIRRSGKIDVYVVSEENETLRKSAPAPGSLIAPGALRAKHHLDRVGDPGRIPRCALAGPDQLVMLYLAAVVIAAVFLGAAHP